MAAQTTFPLTRTIGLPGSRTGNGPTIVEPMRNDEATAEIPFGSAVKHASATDERSAKLLTSITTEKVAGILHRSDTYATTQLGDDGVKPTYELNIMRQGRLLVACEDGCSVGDPLHIRVIVTGAEVSGALLAAADGSDTIDASANGTWRTSAVAGGLAELEFNFTNSPT